MHIDNKRFYELMVKSHEIWDLVDKYTKIINDYQKTQELKNKLKENLSNEEIDDIEEMISKIIIEHNGEITRKSYINAKKSLPGSLKEKTVIHGKLTEMFYILAKNNLRKPCYSGYSSDRKDDMTQRAVINMWKYHRSFGVGEDAKSKNPFSYFTTTCNRLFWTEISNNKKFTNQNRSFGFVENLFSDGELTSTAIPQTITKNKNKEENYLSEDMGDDSEGFVDSNTNVEFNKIIDYDFHDKLISDISEDLLLKVMKENQIDFQSIRKNKSDRFKFNYITRELIKADMSIIDISARLLSEVNNKAIVFNILDQDNRDLLISEIMKFPTSRIKLKKLGIKPKLIRVSDHVGDLLKFYAHEDEDDCAI